MVSNPHRSTDKSPMSPGPPMIVKNYSAIKLLRLFNKVLDVKNKNLCLPGIYGNYRVTTLFSPW